MGLIGNFMRFIASVIIFFVVLFLGIVYSAQLGSFFQSLPGTLDVQVGNSTLVIPVLASIIASVVFTLLLNLLTLPFRARARHAE